MHLHLIAIGESTRAIDEMIKFREDKINILEHELSQIPIYIPLNNFSNQDIGTTHNTEVEFTPLENPSSPPDRADNEIIEVLIKGYDDGVVEKTGSKTTMVPL